MSAPTRLRVALVQNVVSNDHRTIHTRYLAGCLSRRGYDVTVVLAKGGSSHRWSSEYRVAYLSGGTYSLPMQAVFMFSLFLFLRRNSFDVIHAKNPFSALIPAILMRLSGKCRAVVYDIRGLWIDFGVHAGLIPRPFAPLLVAIEKRCMLMADSVIAISQELKKRLAVRGLSAEKIRVVVGDGVDLQEIRSLKAVDLHSQLGTKGRIVGYVGSIARSRNSQRLFESFHLLRQGSELDVRLVLIGAIERDDARFFQEYTKSLGIDELVHFLGYLEHDVALASMKSFDVAVAYQEGDQDYFSVAIPTKILEYMACGKPIVATTQKMFSTLLSDQVDAVLTGQSPMAFAIGIKKVLEDDSLRRRISMSALTSSEKYSSDAVASRTIAVYQEAWKKAAFTRGQWRRVRWDD